jgi:hypothetical protein
MGVSIEALESLLARARRGLKDLMQDDNSVTAQNQKAPESRKKRTRPQGADAKGREV